MDMEKSKSSKASVYGAFIAACLAAFVVGIYVKNSDQVSGSNSCSVNVDVTNVDGNITTRIKAYGSHDGCAEIVSELVSDVQNGQATDDSAASDADATDAASAPCAASQ